MAKSVERDGIFGKYTEHFDDDGHKVGESRERDGVFGTYVEHTDAAGTKTGESRERDGVFETYTEHTDSSDHKTGESREIQGLFGDYTEHTDESGQKIGESRYREGVFEDYTEHQGSFQPHLGTSRSSGRASGSYETSDASSEDSTSYPDCSVASSTDAPDRPISTSSSERASEAWELYLKPIVIFAFWAGGSWLLKNGCDQLLAEFTQYSLAWWVTGAIWLLCWPGIVAGALALLVVSLVILAVVKVFELLALLVQYFIENPY